MINYLIHVGAAICIYILHYRIEKLEELQIKTSDLLLEVVEILEKHNIE